MLMPHGWRIALAVSALCLSSVEPIEARAKEEQLPVRSLNLGD